MYDEKQLSKLKTKPKINDISLSLLANFYEKYLMSNTYKYKIVNECNISFIELRFEKDNFCHLLGIESIAKKSIKKEELFKYKGFSGWKSIKEGKITIKHLKLLNKRQFKNIKAKYVFFYLLPKMLLNPKGVLFDETKTNTKIHCEILLYNKYENAIIHLGIEKRRNQEYYIPRTFFVEKLGKDSDTDVYIIGQQKIDIEIV